MDKKHRDAILDLFYQIRDNGPIDGSEGICCEVWSHFGYDSSTSLTFDKWSLGAFQGWPEGNGCGGSPMPLHWEGLSNWDKSTALGQKRYRLLDYLIQRLEEGA